MAYIELSDMSEAHSQWLGLNVQAHSAEVKGDLREAQRLFELAGMLASNNMGMEGQYAFSCLRVGSILMQYRDEESLSVALKLFQSTLEIRCRLNAGNLDEWDIAEVHHCIAQTQQLLHRYELASESWRKFIRTVNRLAVRPEYLTCINEAAKELLYCRGKIKGMPDPIGYDGISSAVFWGDWEIA
ncbi:MAG TPA: hypothetical protein V6C89_21855 [Drouetiella sp.]